MTDTIKIGKVYVDIWLENRVVKFANGQHQTNQLHRIGNLIPIQFE